MLSSAILYLQKTKQQHERLLASVFYFKLVFGPSARLNTNTTIQQVKVELECNDSQPVACISSCYRNRLARLGTRCFPQRNGNAAMHESTDKTWQNMEREHFPCSSAHLMHVHAKNLFLGRSKCHQNTLFKRQHPPVMLTRSSQTALMAYALHQLALRCGGFFPKHIITTQVKSNWCFFHVFVILLSIS